MNLRRIALILVSVCLFGSFVCAQGARPALGEPAELVELDLSSDIATWNVNVANEGVSLRVTGPRSFVYQSAYAAGDPVFFDFVDESGAPLADGMYRWEIVVTPSDSLRLRRDEQAIREALPAYSGSFRIESGLAVSPDLQEGSLRTRDIIHNDDVIATFSMCIGNDCVNGESFGFDTLRLKENNLRVHFDDTSNSASFPNQDWRLIANDSTNGGGEYFSIEDATVGRRIFTVEGSGPTHSLYVDDGGRVGLGTSTPVVELHVVDGDTPTLRLEQNGSSGFTPQTWDVAGNETNFFVRDATNGSTLPFKIRPGAGNNALVIDNDDFIGIGILNPNAPLHISATVDTVPLANFENNGNVRVDFDNTSTGTDPDWFFGTDGGTSDRFRISASGTGGNELEIQNDGDFFVRAMGTAIMTLTGSTGDVVFTGDLTAASKNFRIDHPLAPDRKYLQHASIESSERVNIYNGTVELDGEGEAWVELPNWFQALNEDFRYQLTSIGAPAPQLHVAEEIVENRFKISGGVPGKKVSWQVAGVRLDPWSVANPLEVEVEKPQDLQGTYLHPDAYQTTSQKAQDQ